MSNFLPSTRLLERLKERKLTEHDNVPEKAAHSRLEKANEIRQRKKEAREKLKAKNSELYELTTLLCNHFRLIVQVNRSAKRMEKFIRKTYGIEL
jgi:hypothetical protein